MDDDEVRRGRPAVHVAFDVPTAINAGDAMLAIAFEMIASSLTSMMDTYETWSFASVKWSERSPKDSRWIWNSNRRTW